MLDVHIWYCKGNSYQTIEHNSIKPCMLSLLFSELSPSWIPCCKIWVIFSSNVEVWGI